jgi:hypothetical protein
MNGVITIPVNLLDGWQRFEEVADDDSRVVVVRWARGTGDSAPGLDFLLDADGRPAAATLEVDRDVSIEEVAAVLVFEYRSTPALRPEQDLEDRAVGLEAERAEAACKWVEAAVALERIEPNVYERAEGAPADAVDEARSTFERVLKRYGRVADARTRANFERVIANFERVIANFESKRGLPS